MMPQWSRSNSMPSSSSIVATKRSVFENGGKAGTADFSGVVVAAVAAPLVVAIAPGDSSDDSAREREPARSADDVSGERGLKASDASLRGESIGLLPLALLLVVEVARGLGTPSWRGEKSASKASEAERLRDDGDRSGSSFEPPKALMARKSSIEPDLRLPVRERCLTRPTASTPSRILSGLLSASLSGGRSKRGDSTGVDCESGNEASDSLPLLARLAADTDAVPGSGGGGGGGGCCCCCCAASSSSSAAKAINEFEPRMVPARLSRLPFLRSSFSSSLRSFSRRSFSLRASRSRFSFSFLSRFSCSLRSFSRRSFSLRSFSLRSFSLRSSSLRSFLRRLSSLPALPPLPTRDCDDSRSCSPSASPSGSASCSCSCSLSAALAAPGASTPSSMLISSVSSVAVLLSSASLLRDGESVAWSIGLSTEGLGGVAVSSELRSLGVARSGACWVGASAAVWARAGGCGCSSVVAGCVSASSITTQASVETEAAAG